MQNTFSTTPNYFHYIANKNLSRETMKAPIAFMLGVLLGNVACLPKDVAKPAQMTQMAKSAQKTETEELSRERRWARHRINSLDGISFHFGSPGLLAVWGKGNREAPTLQQIATSQKESRFSRSFVEKTFVDTPFKAEMCLWDNLGNSTDLHWEASIGQVSLLLILNLLCNDNLSLFRMPSGRAGLGLTRLTAALTEVEMHLLVDFLTH